MTATPSGESSDGQPTLSDVIRRLERLEEKVDYLSREITETQKWQDRTWDSVKWVIGLAAGIVFSAGIALFAIGIRVGLERLGT